MVLEKFHDEFPALANKPIIEFLPSVYPEAYSDAACVNSLDKDGKVHPLISPDFTLQQLNEHFTIPDVPDVATLNPELHQRNLALPHCFMNIVHVRDTMKLVHKEGRIDSQRLHALLHAPVFVYDLAATDDAFNLNEEQREWGKENLIGKDGRLRLPYPAFTLFAHSGADCLHYFVFGPEYPSTIGPGKKGRTFLYLVRYEKNTLARGSTCATAGFSGETDGASFWLDGEPIPTPSEEMVETQTRCFYSIIFRFCFDVMSKTNAVVRVSPKPSPGKSIEWQLARTHYCLLTKQQAMQVRDVRRPITDHDIQRAAHWRRAHFRRLTSERFTHKRGQLVPVAEAWVGPEEWIGLDGKIYKVINLTHPNR